MSLAFSRRSFLKYSAVAAVAVAGASLFSGCESQGDSYNLLQEVMRKPGHIWIRI